MDTLCKVLRYTLCSVTMLLMLTACDFNIAIFGTSGNSGTNNEESLAFEMINNQYINSGAEKVLHIENFKELTKSKTSGGYSYYLQYELVFNKSAKALKEELSKERSYASSPDEDVNRLIRQFGNFKKGTRIKISEQVSVVRGESGLEVQRF